MIYRTLLASTVLLYHSVILFVNRTFILFFDYYQYKNCEVSPSRTRSELHPVIGCSSSSSEIKAAFQQYVTTLSSSLASHYLYEFLEDRIILRVKIRMYLPSSVCTEVSNIQIFYHYLHGATANNIIEENYPNCATFFLCFPFKPLERERESLLQHG